jgi:glutathione synthase/RimK-type ligase-like ATP-grasp enzyme
MTILFVSGVNDRSTIGVTLDGNGQPVYLIDGNASVHRRLPLPEDATGTFLIFGKGVPQHSIEFQKPPSLVFNQIADADTHRGALERCVELCDRLGTPVINHPRQVLKTTRDQVAEMLQGIPALTVPRTLRFNPRSPEEVLARARAEAFEFPFIVRVAGEHGGRRMVRIGTREDAAALHALPFDGRPFYLSQFVDCRDERGMYHKQRITFVDGRPLLRHALFSGDWNIHGRVRDFMLQHETWAMNFAREEALETRLMPGLAQAFSEIARRLQLEYFAMDCCIHPDGQMVLFEANANMNVLHNPFPEMNPRLQRLHAQLQAMLEKYSGERLA